MAGLELTAFDVGAGDVEHRLQFDTAKLSVFASYQDLDGDLELNYVLDHDEICPAVFVIRGVEDITQLIAYCKAVIKLHAQGQLQ